MSDQTATSRVLTLVFTDLADSTALKTQRGDMAGGDLIARHREHVLRLAQENGGSIVDWAGDGCFLIFETASAAVVFTLRLQQIHKYETDLPRVRAGIHLGEVSVHATNGAQRVEGLIVDLAARISGLAQPGQVLISGPVQQSAKQRLGIYEFGQPVRWENYGPYSLKGFDEPIEIREAGLETISPFHAPKASDKAWPKDAVSKGTTFAADAVIRKIAVLPLANMSGDPAQEYFSDGMTEAILTELAKIKALRVISRTSVMQYKNTTKPMPLVAQELGVDALVEGSVLRAGDDVRITAQLIRGTTDEHLWADSYDGTVTNILKLQKEVALAIAREINVTVTAEEHSRISRSSQINPDAYELYLQAIRFGGILTEKNINESINLLQRAVSLDPEFPEAYALMGFAYWQLALWGYGDSAENIRRQTAAERAALRIDEHNANANVGLGWVNFSFDWDWAEAEYRFRRALTLDPNNVWALGGLAFVSVVLGRNEDAFKFNERHIQLDPRTYLPYQFAAVTRFMARDYLAAFELIQRAIGIRKNAVTALIEGVYMAAVVGQHDTAEEWFSHATKLAGRISRLISIHAYARTCVGDFSTAESVLRELEERATTESIPLMDLAWLHTLLGHHEQAIDFLERTYYAREHHMVWMNSLETWDVLRGDSRFQALERKMNFPEIRR